MTPVGGKKTTTAGAIAATTKKVACAPLCAPGGILVLDLVEDRVRNRLLSVLVFVLIFAFVAVNVLTARVADCTSRGAQRWPLNPNSCAVLRDSSL